MGGGGALELHFTVLVQVSIPVYRTHGICRFLRYAIWF